MQPATNGGPAARGAASPDVPRHRRSHLDVLKIVVIGGVIAGHAWAGYDGLGGWAYTDIREVSLGPVSQVVAEAVLGPFGLFAMGLLFLISGQLCFASVRRRGSGRFALDRTLRLGMPLLVFTVVLWPPVRAALDHLGGLPVTPWWMPDPVHLWFLEVLLLYSLGYAAWLRYAGAGPAGGSDPGALTLGHLAVLALAIAAGSFAVRLWAPLGSTGPAALHLCQWPQFLALFGLGVAAARRGWLDPVPDRLRRQCGRAAVLGVAAIGILAVAAAATGVPAQDFLGGLHWAALFTAAAEGLLAATVPIWLLAVAQRHLELRRDTARAARTAYAAFLLQGHVLVGLAVALRPVGAPAEAKACVVAVAGVALCFGIGRVLVERTVLGRIL